MKMVMIKTEESNLLEPCVYREYSGELTNHCLQLDFISSAVSGVVKAISKCIFSHSAVTISIPCTSTRLKEFHAGMQYI